MLARSLKHEISELGSIDDALELLEEVNTKLKKFASDAGDMALHKAKEAGGQALVFSKKAARKIDRSAHQNAWTFVGVASAIAVLIGFYLGREEIL